MGHDERFSITDRWFVDSDVPMASEELTREIRDPDMLPVNEFDEKQLGAALPYEAVLLRGARLLPSEMPPDDDLTDAHDVEDPFDTHGQVELPQTWAGSLHDRLSRAIEGVFEQWDRFRLQTHAVRDVAREHLPRHPALAPNVRVAAAFTAVASLLFVIVGMAAGIAAVGSTVQANQPQVPSKAVVAQQRALQSFAVQWARSQGAATDDTSAGEAQDQPEEQVSRAERRRIARATRAERRREMMRRRRARRR